MRADIPKYRQLAEQTRQHLEATGHAGDRLMSLRDFASRESVSMSTALRVYEELERGGRVATALGVLFAKLVGSPGGPAHRIGSNSRGAQ